MLSCTNFWCSLDTASLIRFLLIWSCRRLPSWWQQSLSWNRAKYTRVLRVSRECVCFSRQIKTTRSLNIRVNLPPVEWYRLSCGLISTIMTITTSRHDRWVASFHSTSRKPFLWTFNVFIEKDKKSEESWTCLLLFSFSELLLLSFPKVTKDFFAKHRSQSGEIWVLKLIESGALISSIRSVIDARPDISVSIYFTLPSNIKQWAWF